MLPNILFLVVLLSFARANQHMSQLYEDLLYYYNRNCRPIANATAVHPVRFGGSLIRIIDVDEVNQRLKTNLWLRIEWHDYRLKWNPKQYNGIKRLMIPPSLIWIPDVVLYTSADGNSYDIRSEVMAYVYYNGMVVWNPPQMYTSYCKIDIRYFPYDEQMCLMKFGGWSNDGFFMDLLQIKVDENDDIALQSMDPFGKEADVSKKGFDLANFIKSKEWSLVNLTSARHAQFYFGCCGPVRYIDITYYISIRRKPLFYTCNLMIPSLLVAFLTTFVFYIPAVDHKITCAINILVQQTVFYNIMLDLLPPSSMDLPLFGEYLLFTIVLVSASIFISVFVINLHRRNGSTDQLPEGMKFWFLYLLPKLLRLKPWDTSAEYDEDGSRSPSILTDLGLSNAPEVKLVFGNSRRKSSTLSRPYQISTTTTRRYDRGLKLSEQARRNGMNGRLIKQMISNVNFIADHFSRLEDEDRISNEWSYVAMVIDRFCLVIFLILNTVGTVLILMQTPYHFDNRPELPVDILQRQPMYGEMYSPETISDWTESAFNRSVDPLSPGI